MAGDLQIRRWATNEQIQAYLLALDLPNATTIDPATGEAYTSAQFDSAVLRGVDYIDLRFWNNFKSQFQYEVADAPADFCADMKRATARAASLELTTPQFFQSVATPASDRQLTKAGPLGWSVGTHATTAHRVRNTQAQDSAIGFLLDKYLFEPVDAVNQDNVCPATGSGNQVMSFVQGRR